MIVSKRPLPHIQSGPDRAPAGKLGEESTCSAATQAISLHQRAVHKDGQMNPELTDEIGFSPLSSFARFLSSSPSARA